MMASDFGNSMLNSDAREAFTLGRIGGAIKGAQFAPWEAVQQIAIALAEYYEARAENCRNLGIVGAAYHEADARAYREIAALTRAPSR